MGNSAMTADSVKLPLTGVNSWWNIESLFFDDARRARQTNLMRESTSRRP
jgi:hypothetical protein